MNPLNNSKSRGGVHLRALLGIVLLLVPLVLMAQIPGWWADKQVLISGSSVTRNDYAAVNQGQVKNIAMKAIAELNEVLPFGAGKDLNDLSVILSSTSTNTNDYASVNVGQLKALFTPFYNALYSIGYRGHPLESGTYPWVSGTTNNANDYAMANIGQVKNLFAFDLSQAAPGTDTDGNGIPDWWEIYYFGHTGVSGTSIEDGGTMTNIEQFRSNLNPTINEAAISETQVKYVYDSAGRLISAAGGASKSKTYVYDAEGNVIGIR